MTDAVTIRVSGLSAGRLAVTVVRVCPHCGVEGVGHPPTEAQRGYLFAVLIEIMRDHLGYARRAEAYARAVHWLLSFPWEQIRQSLAAGAIDAADMEEVVDRLSAALIVDLHREVPDPEPDPVRRYMKAAGIEIGAAA